LVFDIGAYLLFGASDLVFVIPTGLCSGGRTLDVVQMTLLHAIVSVKKSPVSGAFGS
jgi:hypothetical protein